MSDHDWNRLSPYEKEFLGYMSSISFSLRVIGFTLALTYVSLLVIVMLER